MSYICTIYKEWSECVFWVYDGMLYNEVETVSGPIRSPLPSRCPHP